jgi:hypothetical protein
MLSTEPRSWKWRSFHCLSQRPFLKSGPEISAASAFWDIWLRPSCTSSARGNLPLYLFVVICYRSCSYDQR